MKIVFQVEQDNEVVVYLDDIRSGKIKLSSEQSEQLMHIMTLGVTMLNEEEVRLSTDNPHRFMQIGKV